MNDQTTRRLTRDPANKMVGGVAAGLARYFDLDLTCSPD